MIDDPYSSQGASLWETKALSTNFNPPRPTPHVSTISMSPTTNYVVPYSKYNSSLTSHSYIDGRQMQPYQQQPKFQSHGLEPVQPPRGNPTSTK